MEARRANQAPPPLPRLWSIAAGQPETTLAAYRMQPMTRWPEGFWERAPVDRLQIVMVSALPRTRETLLLRLLGRGPTFQDALADLMALPEDAWERQAALPVLVAFRTQLPQHSLEEEDMFTVKEIDTIYAEWEQRMRTEGEGQLLRKQLVRRFGPLPEGVVTRIAQADSATLERWGERLLSASTLDEVFEA